MYLYVCVWLLCLCMLCVTARERIGRACGKCAVGGCSISVLCCLPCLQAVVLFTEVLSTIELAEAYNGRGSAYAMMQQVRDAGTIQRRPLRRYTCMLYAVWR